MWNWTDLVDGNLVQLTNNADRSRTFAAIHMHDNRLYVLDGTVPEGYPEPGLFQQSMGFVDRDGNGIRYQALYTAYTGLGESPMPNRAGGGRGAGAGPAGAAAAPAAGSPAGQAAPATPPPMPEGPRTVVDVPRSGACLRQGSRCAAGEIPRCHSAGTAAIQAPTCFSRTAARGTSSSSNSGATTRRGKATAGFRTRRSSTKN